MFLEALNNDGKRILTRLKSFSDFYLAGGTGLALQIGHRVSVDFDLFSEGEISKNLLVKVKKVFEGEEIAVSVNNSDELTLFVGGVKITFLRYPFSIIDRLVDFDGLKALCAKEISATKAYTIGRRGTLKDYVDLYYILLDKHSSLDQTIGLADKKYGSEFNSRLFLEQLIFLDDVEIAEIVFLKQKVGKEELKTFFEKEIAKIKFI